MHEQFGALSSERPAATHSTLSSVRFQPGWKIGWDFWRSGSHTLMCESFLAPHGSLSFDRPDHLANCEQRSSCTLRRSNKVGPQALRLSLEPWRSPQFLGPTSGKDSFLVFLFPCHWLVDYATHRQVPLNVFTSYECRELDKKGKFSRSTCTWSPYPGCRS